MRMQTDEFYQLDLYQPNFEGLNGTWGGLFSGGRYGWEMPTGFDSYETPRALELQPSYLHQEVGPTPPRWHGDPGPTSVDDSGATFALLGLALIAVAFGLGLRCVCTD
jgi:hypothetical protein